MAQVLGLGGMVMVHILARAWGARGAEVRKTQSQVPETALLGLGLGIRLEVQRVRPGELRG